MSSENLAYQKYVAGLAIREREEQIEHIKNKCFKNIWDIVKDKDEKELLRLRIEKKNGSILLFVHPFYQDYYNRLRFDSDSDSDSEVVGYRNPKIERLQHFIYFLLQKELPNNLSPLIIFEEQKRIRETEERLASYIQDDRQRIYMVPTHSDSPDPIIKGEYSIRSWYKLIDLFKELGIQRIVIGGMHLALERNNFLNFTEQDDWYVKQRQDKYKKIGIKNVEKLNYSIFPCVGKTAAWFSKDFDVRISRFTSPKCRRDIVRLERELLDVEKVEE